MTDDEPAREYVIRRTTDGKYLSGKGQGDGSAWANCQVCAQRFTRDEAHQVHRGNDSWLVVRLRRRATT